MDKFLNRPGRIINLSHLNRKHQKYTTVKVNILLADDDYVNYLYFSELLREGGIQLFRAVSLGQLLFKLKTNPTIKLILFSSSFAAQFDYNLNSYIRRKYPEFPQVIFLEEGLAPEARRRMEEDCDTVLGKQTDSNQIFEAISDLLNTSSHVKYSINK